MLKGLSYLSGLKPWGGSGSFSTASISSVLKKLNDPQDKVKSIHIAGTNGKGSVSAGIASILGASGYRVGLTISPHLSRINERIVLDGTAIGDSELSDAAIDVMQAANSVKVELSFFEAITACFFLVSANHGLDFIVVETGLGGRLDATNVISRPELSCITSIDYDHVAILGETLSKISTEKAGIIKPGVPVVVGELSAESLEPISRAAMACSSKMYNYGVDFLVMSSHDIGEYFGINHDFEIRPSLPGQHQLRNMSIVAAVGEIVGLKVDSIQAGISSVFWPGRLESFGVGEVEIVIDAAHNPHGIRALAAYLRSRGVTDSRIIFGAIDTKEWQTMVRELEPFFSTWVIVPPSSERAVPPEVIIKYLSSIGISEVTVSTASSAVDLVMEGSPFPLTFISGSIYMIGGIRQELVTRLGITDRPIWRRV